ncbi:MAG: ATP-binding cassette domain-containing protein [Clostridia bacterium]|nr:ATP-binding cassette domain-containing protein [Clostridia bacterium]
MEILRVEDLSFTYPERESPTVREVSLSVQEGDFVLLCGATGSGKSTLLRLLKRELSPIGRKSGTVYYRGTLLEQLEQSVSACSVGFVAQNPEQQIVTDRVWHELAFGLENMNLPQSVIARRVAEMASYFGIEHWYDKQVSELSGGQKQLLNLASVMVMGPDLLILDEPTAQLDPIAASDFIATLKKLNRDLSLTVILVEHRLEELIPICDRLLVMDGGRLVHDGTPRDMVSTWKGGEPLWGSMPAAARIYRALSGEGDCPLGVREGRRWMERTFENRVRRLPRAPYTPAAAPALEFRQVFMRYQRDLPDVLRGMDLCIFENEIFCLLGGNGSGKTTVLGVAAGYLKHYRGDVKIFGKKLGEYKNQSLYRECISLLPQDVQTVFLRNTVREELADSGLGEGEFPFDLSALVEAHPYDLSGGEQQLLALAKVLATRPRLLLMDEPTKGLDAEKKKRMAEILRDLKAKGITVLIVTHDVEFAAECADRCALFFRGQVVSHGIPSEFFSENHFYTTATSRMTKGYFDGAVTVEDAVALCRANERREGGTVC